MFVGRSEEEMALAGEEMGWSPIDALKNVFRTPVAEVAATSIFGPTAAAAVTLVKTATGQTSPKGRGSAKGGKGDATADQGPSDASDGSSGKSSKSSDVVGAGSFSDEYIEHHIANEQDPDKKARMVYNHQRAKRMRTSSMGAALGVVDDAIGALFARTPVDAQSRPTLTKGNLGKLVALVTQKVGSHAKARALVASYVRINNIATPGLRVVKRR